MERQCHGKSEQSRRVFLNSELAQEEDIAAAVALPSKQITKRRPPESLLVGGEGKLVDDEDMLRSSIRRCC